LSVFERAVAEKAREMGKNEAIESENEEAKAAP